MSSPFTPDDKIKLMEAFCTLPVCALLGAVAAWVGIALGWGTVGMVMLSVTLVLVFSLTPLANMLRGWVRRKAESYYYGT
jgi:hypothetical protein